METASRTSNSRTTPSAVGLRTDHLRVDVHGDATLDVGLQWFVDESEAMSLAASIVESLRERGWSLLCAPETADQTSPLRFRMTGFYTSAGQPLKYLFATPAAMVYDLRFSICSQATDGRVAPMVLNHAWLARSTATLTLRASEDPREGLSRYLSARRETGCTECR